MPSAKATAAPIEKTPVNVAAVDEPAGEAVETAAAETTLKAIEPVTEPEGVTAEAALEATVDDPAAPVAVETVAVASPEPDAEAVGTPAVEESPADTTKTLSEGTPTIAELADHPDMATSVPPASASEAESATPGVIATPAEITPQEIASPAQPPASSPAPEASETVEVAAPTPGELSVPAVADSEQIAAEPEGTPAAVENVGGEAGSQPVVVATGADGEAVTAVATTTAPLVVEVLETVAPPAEGEVIPGGVEIPAGAVELPAPEGEPVAIELEAVPPVADGDGDEPDDSVGLTETSLGDPADPEGGGEAVAAGEPLPPGEPVVNEEVVDAAAPAPSGDQPPVVLEVDAPLPADTADAPPINTESVPPSADTPEETPAAQEPDDEGSVFVSSALNDVACDLSVSYGLETASWLVALRFAAGDLARHVESLEDKILAVNEAIKQDTADGREKMSRACRRATNEAFPDFPNDERVGIARELAAILGEMALKADSEAVQAAIAEALK